MPSRAAGNRSAACSPTPRRRRVGSRPPRHIRRGLERRLLHKAWDGSTWYPSPDGWEDLGGVLTCPPTAVAWDPGGSTCSPSGSAEGCGTKPGTGAAWQPSPTGWEPLGGGFTSAPVAVSPGPGRLDVFALGLNRGMWHKAWDGRSLAAVADRVGATRRCLHGVSRGEAGAVVERCTVRV